MTYGNDDPDADDEYSDLKQPARRRHQGGDASCNSSAGFQAFAPDHALLLASDGIGGTTGIRPTLLMFDGTSGALPRLPLVPTGGRRATQPDWSADGSRVVFVQPAELLRFAQPTAASTTTTSPAAASSR